MPPTASPFRRSRSPRRCLPEMARGAGIACAGITRSHHCGAAGHPVERLAEAGLVAMLFANTPGAIAPWGGTAAVFGTNPIAFACPLPDAAPIVVDLSLSKVARGNILAARQKGERIPEGWALDAAGKPTTDPDGRARRHHAAARRRQGHGAGADGRAARRRPHRRELRGRGVVVPRCGRAAAGHRAVDHRDRSRGVSAAGSRISPASRRRSRRSPAHGCRARADSRCVPRRSATGLP